MNLENARRLLASIPPNARVVDVGGGAAPFPRSDWVIDALPFESLGSGSDGDIHRNLDYSPRYTRDTWVKVDLCDRRPWPVPDQSFDYAICSHLLEDVRDPIWVCSEIRRVARAGYIEVPSRALEQSKGVENPRHAGFYHHRWLVTAAGNRLEFRHKPHVLHSVNAAIVASIPAGWRVNPRHAFLAFEWAGGFESVEVLEFDERAVVADLCEFASRARQITDFLEKVPMPFMSRIKRKLNFRRLARGRW